jgi:hypothetical protein
LRVQPGCTGHRFSRPLPSGPRNISSVFQACMNREVQSGSIRAGLAARQNSSPHFELLVALSVFPPNQTSCHIKNSGKSSCFRRSLKAKNVAPGNRATLYRTNALGDRRHRSGIQAGLSGGSIYDWPTVDSHDRRKACPIAYCRNSTSIAGKWWKLG